MHETWNHRQVFGAHASVPVSLRGADFELLEFVARRAGQSPEEYAVQVLEDLPESSPRDVADAALAEALVMVEANRQLIRRLVGRHWDSKRRSDLEARVRAQARAEVRGLDLTVDERRSHADVIETLGTIGLKGPIVPFLKGNAAANGRSLSRQVRAMLQREIRDRVREYWLTTLLVWAQEQERLLLAVHIREGLVSAEGVNDYRLANRERARECLRGRFGVQ